MYNSGNDQLNQNADSQEVYVAKLAFIGAALSTLGDGIQAIAAGLVLQQLENTNKKDSQDNENMSKDLDRMQKQIDLLNEQISKMTK